MQNRWNELHFVIAAALAAVCSAGCETGQPAVLEPSGEGGGAGTTFGGAGGGFPACDAPPACNSALTVDADGPALLITDPVVLAEVPLTKVLPHISTPLELETSATEMLQRFFDTMNSTEGGRFPDVRHCDDSLSPTAALKSGDTLTCPRAEGALAFSEGLLEDGDPDSFFPVAVINRFDLTTIDGGRCGQYRIVYAKTSGLSDPNDRVFLIFEAALQNPVPGCVEGCRPIAEHWHGMQGKSSAEIATRVRQLFFEGLAGFMPAVHPLSYGLVDEDGGYGGLEPGQIRVSMHMQDPWDMRELRMGFDPETGNPALLPTTVKNNPPPFLFDPLDGSDMRYLFQEGFIEVPLWTLAGKELKDVQLIVPGEVNAAESLLDGKKKNDYLAATFASGGSAFFDQIQDAIDSGDIGAGCPSGDPLDAAAILKRATALSCAGCHAPSELLGEDRSIGCGLVWPDSLGQAHIDETGKLSPALRDVFLPRRAEVLETFLQACDMDALTANLQPVDPNAGFVQKMQAGGMKARTLGGARTH